MHAVIGDSVARTLFAPDPKKKINYAQPLLEGVRLQNATFDIVGTCVDPINNGEVIYVPLQELQGILSMPKPNVVLVKLDPSADRAATLTEIKNRMNSISSDLTVFELDEVLKEDIGFLGSAWSTMMLLPTASLISAAFCLVGYVMLAADEQRQEFAVLRAVGAKPNTVVAVIAVQSLIVLLSSFAVGISFGVITTLLILMPHPVVTIVTIAEIAGWLFAALVGMFLLSLYPAVKLSKMPILKIMG